MGRHVKVRKPIAVVTSIALAFSLAVAPGVASARTADRLATGAAATGAAASAGTAGMAGTAGAAGVPEWAVDDGEGVEGVEGTAAATSGAAATAAATSPVTAGARDGQLATQAALPAKYDLRDEGVVTPVKAQDPWGSCWSFGGTAAAETSILSSHGAVYEDEPIDLSERHLAYFALNPVTASVDPDQEGEGMATLDTESPNAAFDAGGDSVFVTTLFSQGVGPVSESMFPYRGVDAEGKSHTRLGLWEANPEKATREQLAKELGGEAAVDPFLEAFAANNEMTMEQALEYWENRVREVFAGFPTYAATEDWSIPEFDAEGNPNRLWSDGDVLKDGNVLPTYWNADKTEINVASQNAIKQELVNGHGVSIGFRIDQSGTFTVTPDVATGGTNKLYTQYVSDPTLPANHGVCIVGWDDDFAASNFASAPAGNGAWIVKNSWGSQTEAATDDLGNTINQGTFGTVNDEGKATGYFYLSYYDKTIAKPETMEFTSNLLNSGGFYTLQHDYMPAYGGFYQTTATPDITSSANVFKTEKDDGDMVLRSVSTRTSEANMRVTFAIYLLKEGAANPADGTLVYRTSRNFEYGGFHRLDLDRPIMIAAGQAFSVVATASTIGADGTRSYSVSANQGLSREAAEYYVKEQGVSLKLCSSARVNEGESFLYRDSDKSWIDWGEYIAGLPPADSAAPGATHVEQYPIDNFSIKAYAEPVEPTPVDLSAAKVTVAPATFKGGKAVKPAVTVKLDGVTLSAGTDYAVSYANNKLAGKAVAIVKGTGAYTGSATKVFAIAKAENTLTVKAKVKTNKVKRAKLKVAPQVIKKSAAFVVSKAQGAVAFAKVSGNRNISVGKDGTITVKQGLKAKTYPVKVAVKAVGDANYKPLTKYVKLKIRVR